MKDTKINSPSDCRVGSTLTMLLTRPNSCFVRGGMRLLIVGTHSNDGAARVAACVFHVGAEAIIRDYIVAQYRANADLATDFLGMVRRIFRTKSGLGMMCPGVLPQSIWHRGHWMQSCAVKGIITPVTAIGIDNQLSLSMPNIKDVVLTFCP